MWACGPPAAPASRGVGRGGLGRARLVPLRDPPYAGGVSRLIPGLVGLVVAAVVVTGCTAPRNTAPAPSAASPSPVHTVAQPPGRGAAEARPPVTPPPTPTDTATTPGPRPGPTVAPTDSPKAGRATGPITDTPFEVKGIPVVSKDHRLSASYVPPWAGQPHGLHPDVTASFQRLRAAARADNLTLTIRSGYRGHATQKDSFNRALTQYPEKTARLYFAEAGASEHQTGLALDVWDGLNRGAAFARTEHATWLAANAHTYGFIIRYPQGKTHITGYAWESWHLRWVGTEVSSRFGPHSSLTLEEYLGIG